MRLARLLLFAAAANSAAAISLAQAPPAPSYERITTLESSLSAGTATKADQLELARLYNDAGRYYEATRITSRLLVDDPNDAQVRGVDDVAKKAVHEAAMRKVADAEDAARRSGATDVDRLALADAYFDAGQYHAAADAYAKTPAALRTRDVRLREARSLAWSSQTDRAERAYAQLLGEESTPALQLEYGRVLTWMGNSPAAVRVLRDAYTGAPSEDALIALANARAWSGDREGAIALLHDYDAAHPEAAEARALERQFAASPELQLERLDRRISAEPYNLALHVARARMLYDASRFGEAQHEVDLVREHAHGKIADLDPLAANIARRRSEELATLDQRLAALAPRADSAMSSASTVNADELLSLAKAYNGLGAYGQSTKLYDRYLQLRPDDSDARIQYARVLSWDRRWGASETQYERLLRQMPDRADLRLEYARVLSYEPDYPDAIHVFRQLTDLHANPRASIYPDVPSRAHYNLGQIYRWFGWNEHAVVEQNSAIGLDPGYDDARQELDLARHVRPAASADARYTYSTDSDGFTLKRVDLEAAKWTSQRMQADIGVGRHDFQHAGEDVHANVISGGAAYRYSDRLTARGRAGLDFYDRGLGTRPFFAIGAEYLPNIQSRASLDLNHYDLVYDVFTLTSLGQPGPTSQLDLHHPISINDLRGHYDWNGGGFFSWLADASYGLISDDNKRAAAHGLATFRVIKAPFVAFKIDGRYLKYDFRTNRYWSPGDYHSIAGVVQVGQTVREKFTWNFEVKAGRAYESHHSSDLRSYEGNLTVPVSDAFDLVGNYGYGKSGRLDSLFAGSGSSGDFVNYWQRHWYVGVRVKQLFAGARERHPRNQYYYDPQALGGSPVIPPLGEAH